ncbi:MAG TPA: hypothetical protein VLZ83_03070 [Edaphocola sp.]|nr:hypothetical protein [Edaphocola sp.]
MTRQILFGVLIVLIASWSACEKYKDPKEKDLGLTREYCNDPSAINYNDSFPGVPNNSVCIFPTDLFEGNWHFQDSVFTPDGTFLNSETYILTFTAKDPSQDSLKRKLTLTGLCPSVNINLSANRYGLALTDTLIPYTDGGQFFCQNTDTISGQFKVIRDSLNNNMKINFTIHAPDNQFLHIGKAIKQ